MNEKFTHAGLRLLWWDTVFAWVIEIVEVLSKFAFLMAWYFLRVHGRGRDTSLVHRSLSIPTGFISSTL